MNKNINLGSIVLIFLISGSCIHLVRTPNLSIDRHNGELIDNDFMYCNKYISNFEQETFCRPLVFFQDGTLFADAGLLDLSENDHWFSTNENLYEKNSKHGWGRYYIKKDTIYFEYIEYFNLGGSPWMPKFSKYAINIGKDSLLVMPSHYHRKQFTIFDKELPALFKANDTLLYVKTDYPDIYNIDPDKAWINRK